LDFGIIPTFLTIPYGKTAGTYTLPIFDDTINEPDESLTMTIASAIAGTVGTPSVVSTLIDDNEARRSP
jgi:hypothetical protein